MPVPSLNIDLNKIFHNARELVSRLASHRISTTGVTKVMLGSIEIANTMLRAGVKEIGDSRIENIKAMRLSKSDNLRHDISLSLLRSPMLSQVPQVVKYADTSLNTELEVIRALSLEAARFKRVHQIILMVELGDLREGIMPADLIDTVREVIELPYIRIIGIGANLACYNGVSPDTTNMAELSRLADSIEATFGLTLEVISGGNSANLSWLLNKKQIDVGRINNLRLGESILLGRETLHRRAIDGLYSDAITLTAEVIESKLKPSQPTGKIAQSAFGAAALESKPGTVRQAILAIGIQDVDPAGLRAPKGIEILGASSDHLILQSNRADLFVGQKLLFQISYSALLRAMTSPYVAKVYENRIHAYASPATEQIGRPDSDFETHQGPQQWL